MQNICNITSHPTLPCNLHRRTPSQLLKYLVLPRLSAKPNAASNTLRTCTHTSSRQKVQKSSSFSKPTAPTFPRMGLQCQWAANFVPRRTTYISLPRTVAALNGKRLRTLVDRSLALAETNSMRPTYSDIGT